uniref:Uncharacterized protein n=1 Tax=Meloidogyne javanica TaxID=6303 RepID=A0A915LJP4_MELJA
MSSSYDSLGQPPTASSYHTDSSWADGGNDDSAYCLPLYSSRPLRSDFYTVSRDSLDAEGVFGSEVSSGPKPIRGKFIPPFDPVKEVRKLALRAVDVDDFLGLTANTTSFSLTIICMVEGSNGNITQEELQGKNTAWGWEWEWDFKRLAYSTTERNSLFSAAALGSIISGLAITSLIGRFGLRNVLSAYGFLSGLTALALPLAAATGFIPMFIIRMLQGSAGPAQYVMIGTVARDWAPRKSIVTITTDTTEEETSKNQSIPYKSIIGDCVVWLVLLTYWSDEIGFEMLGQFGPTYLNRVLGIDIRTTGIISATTYLLSVGVKVLAGWIYTHLPLKGERARINIFTALTQ